MVQAIKAPLNQNSDSNLSKLSSKTWLKPEEEINPDKPPTKDPKTHVNWESKTASPSLSRLPRSSYTSYPHRSPHLPANKRSRIHHCGESTSPSQITSRVLLRAPPSTRQKAPKPAWNPQRASLFSALYLYISLEQLASAHEDWE